ncbi:hypothetical protein Harman_40610 [Haloarcula mannanilytica]|uniref:Uncharacterized protein n=1 Tax=Haloarcula mannanilytica TaxID=2509225 RepID=A0A4C2EP38_9EURY|nr:hypothetical protein Harman_40610 [Haloarcula mannanilytica]
MNIRPLLTVFLIISAGSVASVFLFPTLSHLSDPPDVTISDTPTIDPSVPAPYQGTKAEPTTVIQVDGAGDRFPIQIWNDSPTNRTVAVELIHNQSHSSLVTQTETLPPNGTVRLEIRSPGYLLKVTDEATQTTGTYPVTTAHFDCNSRFAEVRIDGNGNIDSQTVSTSMGC